MPPKILTGYYKVQNTESLEEVLVNKLGQKDSFRQQTSRDIKKWNPEVKNWSELPIGEVIYLEVPYVSVSEEVFLSWVNIKTDKAEEHVVESGPLLVVVPEKTFVSALSLFAASSYGSFNENLTTTGTSATTKQISPLTLGLSYQKKYLPKNWGYSSSGYISYLTKGQSNGNTAATSVSIPPELGVNIYFVKSFYATNDFYLGNDLERFSTFNLKEVTNGSATTLSTHENIVSYLTAGVSRFFLLKEKKLLLKFSLSQSFWSTADANIQKYHGQKMILFLNYPLTQAWSVQSFFKYHQMTGDTELKITRIGLGLAYLF